MKLLLNDKEIAHFLISSIDIKKKIKEEVAYTDDWVTEVTNQFAERDAARKRRAETKFEVYVPLREFMDDAGKKKFYEKLVKGVSRDTEAYVKSIKLVKSKIKEDIFNGVHKNIETIIKRLGKEKILEKYQQSKYKNFVKGTGNTLTQNPQLMRRKDFKSFKEDCLIRNTVGNEELLVTKIDKKYPMWLIDSGYTN